MAERVALGELAEQSAYVIRTVLANWERFAGPPPWTVDQVIEWVDGSPAANSRKSRLTKLRPFCEWLVTRGELDRDPTLRVRRGPSTEMPPRCLTTEDVKSVLAHLTDDRAHAAVLVMAACGLRIGEVVSIDGADLDMRLRSIRVRGKGGRGEVTRISPVPEAVWRRLRTLRVGDGPVFRSKWTGERLSADRLRRIVTEAMLDSGVKTVAGDGVSPHSLRHTFAQDLIDSGVDLRLVQLGLGHRSIRSTELYIRLDPPGLREAIEHLPHAA